LESRDLPVIRSLRPFSQAAFHASTKASSRTDFCRRRHRPRPAPIQAAARTTRDGCSPGEADFPRPGVCVWDGSSGFTNAGVY
jgi:hypothetical protein